MKPREIESKEVGPLEECGFCERILEEDEELEPVFVGTMESRIARETIRVPKAQKSVGFKCDMDMGIESNTQVLGRSLDEVNGLIRLIEQSDMFDVDVKRKVVEYEPSFDQSIPVGKKEAIERRSFSENVREGEIAVELSVHPIREEQNEPDLEVCEYCADKLKE